MSQLSGAFIAAIRADGMMVRIEPLLALTYRTTALGTFNLGGRIGTDPLNTRLEIWIVVHRCPPSEEGLPHPSVTTSIAPERLNINTLFRVSHDLFSRESTDYSGEPKY